MDNKIMDNRIVAIDYTNWEGIRSIRYVKPKYIYFGSTKLHKEPQWLLKGFDLVKQDWRRYTLKEIHSWRPINEEEEKALSVTC